MARLRHTAAGRASRVTNARDGCQGPLRSRRLPGQDPAAIRDRALHVAKLRSPADGMIDALSTVHYTRTPFAEGDRG